MLLPNKKPSYQRLTLSLISESPYSSNAENTSSSVKPYTSAYFTEVVVTTSILLKSENRDSLLTLVIPVIRPLSIAGYAPIISLYSGYFHISKCSNIADSL